MFLTHFFSLAHSQKISKEMFGVDSRHIFASQEQNADELEIPSNSTE